MFVYAEMKKVAATSRYAHHDLMPRVETCKKSRNRSLKNNPCPNSPVIKLGFKKINSGPLRGQYTDYQLGFDRFMELPSC